LEVLFPGDKHCEAILAAFLAYYLDIASSEEKNDPKLKEVYEVLTFEIQIHHFNLLCRD
jgi:hypothetical protein